MCIRHVIILNIINFFLRISINKNLKNAKSKHPVYGRNHVSGKRRLIYDTIIG